MIYRFEEFSLDVDRQELRRGAELLSVEPKTLDLLHFLIRNRTRVVTKDDLITHVWHGRIVSESALTSRITAMRHAIGDTGKQQRLVRTIARKGLRFVGEVREDDGRTGASSRPEHVEAPTPRASQSAERRPLTILQCRVAGLMDLSKRLDPEDLGSAIASCQECIRAIVDRHRGNVANCAGAEVHAYFGHQQADEDDAERAVEAGLEITKAVGGLKIEAGGPLQASVSIATGVVVVGEPQNGGSAAPTVGEIHFIAARLLSAAPPGKVLISGGTRRLLGKLFDCRPIDTGSGDTPAFEVLTRSTVESRFEALERRRDSALVGRDEELELLTRRWHQTKQGSGRVLLVVGEPGIGKSRLVQALRDRVGSEARTQTVFHCSPHHQSSALHPVIERLARASGIERDDKADTRLNKLEALLAQSGEGNPEEIALLSSLLSIPASDRFPVPALPPQRLKERTFAALMAYLKRMTGLGPLLAIFEDIHWIDPTSLELLSWMVEQAPTMGILIVATSRPEFKVPWPTSRHTSSMLLGRLDRYEGHALISALTGGRSLPPDVIEQILDRTDGVPLYIEELSRTIMESGLLRANINHFELIGSLDSRAIPPTLHASLLARIDRLGPVREIAQVGAAVGRRFSFAQIAAVAALPVAELEARLAQLVAAELIYQRGTPPDASYEFKHALVQDAAYASLLRTRRKQLHGDIARALEREFPDIVESEPESLAHHLTEAGLLAPALGYWLKAGQRAAERSADQEAVRHLQRGIALLEMLPASADRDRIELDFQITLGTPLASVHGYANAEVGAAAERATVLAERLGKAASLFAPLYAQFTYLYITGKTRRALQIGQRLHDLGIRQADRVMQMMANRAMGVVVTQVGDFVAGQMHFEKALSLYEREEDGSLGARFLTDPFASTSALLSITLWVSGYPDRAAKMS